MKSKKIILLIVVSLTVFVFLIARWFGNEQMAQLERQASITTVGDKVSGVIAEQKILQEKSHRHQQQDNEVIHGLTSVQVNSINEFVGRERAPKVEDLPAGGKKIQLNGTYRHAVVLKRNEHGKIKKVEIGSRGIAHDE